MNSFNNKPGSGADAFTSFWTDLFSRVSVAGFGQSGPNAQDEMMRKMRQAFFDAWGSHCEEFMRSPEFLEGMKKAMDGALAFKQQLNEFLTRALHDSQMPARSDTDSILLVLRSLEERVLARVDEQSKRLDALARQVDTLAAQSPKSAPSPAAAGSGGNRPRGGAR